MQPMFGQHRQVISLRTFLAEYKEIANELPIDYSQDEDTLMRLENKCSLEKLCCEDDPIICDYVPDCRKHTRKVPTKLPEKAVKLNTVELLKTHKDRSVKNPFTRTRDIFQYVSDNTSSSVENLDFYNELVIWVRVYRPARVTHIGRTLENPVFAEEFVCLGENYLSELRDKISCICNRKRFFDISDNPYQPNPDKETDPGFFFITDTFYNDTRNKNNADYSSNIRAWAEKAKITHLKVAKMQETKFIDLSVSLGAAQLYKHHGNCEHLFTISQVELLTPSIKCFPRAEYPRCVTFSAFNDRPCQMCGRYQFVFVVEESDRQLHDPAYLCDECFKRYHYVDGKKVGNFKAYRLKDLSVDVNRQHEIDDVEYEIEFLDEVPAVQPETVSRKIKSKANDLHDLSVHDAQQDEPYAIEYEIDNQQNEIAEGECEIEIIDSISNEAQEQEQNAVEMQENNQSLQNEEATICDIDDFIIEVLNNE